MPSANVRRSSPTVTVLVPARNEEQHIEGCLEAIAAQDYDHDRLELIVVDGGSTDTTAERARLAIERLGLHGKVVDNPIGTTPSNLNVGLAHATGEYLCRVDARSVVPQQYVTRCVQLLSSWPNVAVVGGAQVARARTGASTTARAIARALRNPYAMGLARYRRHGGSGVTDTVYLGAFRTTELRSEGGWNERFSSNQDYELNGRMKRRGSIWFDSTLDVGYIPRESLSKLAQQYRRFGRWKAAGWLEADVHVAPRQLVLLALPPAAALTAVVAFRRYPLATAVGGALVGLALESKVREPAPVGERLGAICAIGIVAGSWWGGTVEQAARFARGQRLLAR